MARPIITRYSTPKTVEEAAKVVYMWIKDHWDNPPISGGYDIDGGDFDIDFGDDEISLQILVLDQHNAHRLEHPPRDPDDPDDKRRTVLDWLSREEWVLVNALRRLKWSPVHVFESLVKDDLGSWAEHHIEAAKKEAAKRFPDEAPSAGEDETSANANGKSKRKSRSKAATKA